MSEQRPSPDAGHQQTIESLARETDTPIDDVRRLYSEEHANLATSARVKTFLPVLVGRRVRNILHSRSNRRAGAPRAHG